MQPRLLVKVLPRIAQVEPHRRNAGGPCRWFGRLVREAPGPQGRRLVAVGAVGPLPGRLPVCLGQVPGGIEMIAVDGIQLPVDLGGDRHGAIGRGQVEVLALPAAAGAAHAVFAQQAALLVVQVGPAEVLCIARLGAPQACEEVGDALQEAWFFFVLGR